MQIVVGVLVSFAAALAFFIFEPLLLGLDENMRIFAAGFVFFIVVSTTLYLNHRQPPPSEAPRSIGVGNEAANDLEIELNKVQAKEGSGNIASQNRSGRNTKIKISNSDL